MIKGTAKIDQGLPFSLFHKVRSRVRSRLSEDCKIDRMHYPPVELQEYVILPMSRVQVE